ncbi:MAG: hypothetical protein V1719_01180 [Patescibacteria group bacterium]
MGNAYTWRPPTKKSEQLPEKIVLSQALAIIAEALPILASEHARETIKFVEIATAGAVIHNQVRQSNAR